MINLSDWSNFLKETVDWWKTFPIGQLSTTDWWKNLSDLVNFPQGDTIHWWENLSDLVKNFPQRDR